MLPPPRRLLGLLDRRRDEGGDLGAEDPGRLVGGRAADRDADRALLAFAVVSTGGAVVVSGVLLGQLLDDPRGGFTAGQAGATVVWMAAAALLLLRGLRGSTIAVPAGLTLAAASVVKLLLFDLAFLGGLARVVSFIVAGLLLLGMGAGYAQALERSRREGTDRTPPGPPPGPVDNPTAPTPIPPTV